MRILFAVSNFGFLRNFESALRQLVARGHEVHLVADRRDSVGGTRTIDGLLSDYPGRVTYAYAAGRKDAFWQPLAVYVRLCLDYWRYLDPRYDQSPTLRARAARQAPPFASRLPRWPLIGAAPVMRVWEALFRWVERAMPPSAAAMELLRERNPDLLLVTPLLYFGSVQVEYVRAARALGVPVVLGVGSWDHLTTKGRIHEIPDRVVVWNDFQSREAVELHGVDPARVTVTGAQAYDHWFVQTPTLSREAFCARVGLPDNRPILLYLCSSPFITPYEVGFVRRWLAAIRAHADPALRGASILIRPHPQNAAQWGEFDAGAEEAVAIWPRGGANPVDTVARADYYDSMYHSVAMVGVNTSALIESGIVGRPVYTVLTEEFAGQQEGTLHFQHLKHANGGLLTVGATLGEHLDQLAGAMRGDFDPQKGRAFVEAFIRPHGLDTPAAARFVEVIEGEAAAPRPAPRPPSGSFARWLLHPVAALARAAAARRKRLRREESDAGGSRKAALRILFVLGSPEYLRYFDSTMRLLAERGHAVLLAVNALGERKEARLDLLGDARIEVVGVVPLRTGFWTPLAHAVRGTMDFIRYLHPDFAHAESLRVRMRRKALPDLFAPLDRLRSLRADTLARVMRGLQFCERMVPVSPAVREFLAAQHPDVVVVSPLVDAASEQVDVVRAAHAAGLPVVAAIASWDNLTNKGHMRVSPDLVTVWNENQKREAVQYHGIAPERVAVTGAQLFDRWFEREPSQTREAFCAMVGLPDARPFVLFTGSSVFIARSETEVPFVRRWIQALRASGDPALRDLAVLVRPHPFNADAWVTADFTDVGPVAVWPRRRYTPADESARASLFDSLFHGAAVVGINTSAMIEAAILGKPVLSLLTGEFAGTQEGTLHFHYLLPENGGFVQTASTLDEHVGQLREGLQAPELTLAQTQHFVIRFLRPYGLADAGTPRLVDAFERAGRRELRRPATSAAYDPFVRPLFLPLALLTLLLNSIGLMGAGARAQTRRVVYEAAFLAGRTRRILQKRLLEHPARRVRRLVHQTRKRTVPVVLQIIRQKRADSRRHWRSVARQVRKNASYGVRRVGRAGRLAFRLVRWPAVRARRVVRHVHRYVVVRLRRGALPTRDSNEIPRQDV